MSSFEVPIHGETKPKPRKRVAYGRHVDRRLVFNGSNPVTTIISEGFVHYTTSTEVYKGKTVVIGSETLEVGHALHGCQHTAHEAPRPRERVRNLEIRDCPVVTNVRIRFQDIDWKLATVMKCPKTLR
jgi:hypothetical protein